MNKLYVVEGPMKNTSFNLEDSITTLGGSPDNDICIADKSVSRHHARVLEKNSKIFIQDLGSSRGVIIDGEKIEPGKEVEIRKGSHVLIGNTMLSFQRELSGKKWSANTLKIYRKNVLIRAGI